MRWLLGISRGIDAISGFLGRAMCWVAIALVAIGVINVFTRYVGAQIGMQLGSNALLEAQTQAYNLIFLLGAAYLLQRDGHIRVDIIHSRLRPRTRDWIDIFGTVFGLLPFCAVMFWFSWPYVMRSWERLQVSPNPDGLPLYPIKTVMLIAFALLFLQGISELIKRIDRLRAPHDDGAPGPNASGA